MDILEQLLALEKQAAALVTAAETVAGQRKAAARVAAQSAHVAELKKAAENVAAAVDAERARLAGERTARNAAYREQLAARPVAAGDLATEARRFLAGDA
ncbi:MAG: hypothetical protein NTU62_07735 [Spirochaetes bacterium]|nr:hypothetical protein [Spirochaetota bacterium]